MKSLLFLSLLVPAALFAQADEHITLNCRILAVNQKPEEIWYAHTGVGETYAPVEVGTDFLSSPVKLAATKEAGIVLYRQVKVPPKDPKDKPVFQYLPVLSCRPAAGKRQLLLAFKGESQWTAQARDDGADEFANGTSWIFNLADADVGFDFGGTKLEVPKGGFGKLGRPLTIADGSVSIAIFEKQPAGWKKFFQSFWAYDPNTRQLLFIYRDAASKRIAIRGIDDTRLPDAEEKAKPGKSTDKSKA